MKNTLPTGEDRFLAIYAHASFKARILALILIVGIFICLGLTYAVVHLSRENTKKEIYVFAVDKRTGEVIPVGYDRIADAKGVPRDMITMHSFATGFIDYMYAYNSLTAKTKLDHLFTLIATEGKKAVAKFIGDEKIARKMRAGKETIVTPISVIPVNKIGEFYRVLVIFEKIVLSAGGGDKEITEHIATLTISTAIRSTKNPQGFKVVQFNVVPYKSPGEITNE